jgi:copper chaperone CopZ
MTRILAAVVGVAVLAVGGLVVAGPNFFATSSPQTSQAVIAEAVSTKEREGFRTISLDVQKMDCAACAYILRRALEDVDGVASAKVSYGEETAVVTYDPARCGVAQLVAATAGVGFPSTVIE